MNIQNHCLTRKEYKQILDKKFRGVSYDDEYIKNLYQACESWDKRLIGINHFLSIILEQYIKQGIDCKEVINYIYSLDELIYFHIEEIDSAFISNLYTNHLPESFELEECLIEAQNSIYE